MILRGEKVILRPIRLTDAPAFVKWFNDKQVNKFLTYRSMNLINQRKYIKDRLSGKTKDSWHFCIDAMDGTHIGATSLDAINEFHRRATFGIMIGDKKYWNSGYGSEAARLIIDYGFKKLKLHRIDLDVYSYNPRAIKVYKRLGFKEEGRKIEYTKLGKKFYDAIMMSMLDRDWKRIEKMRKI
jgi:RimJ/RimL family protein N-acetyltransferase